MGEGASPEGRLRKWVETEDVTITVPVTKEAPLHLRHGPPLDSGSGSEHRGVAALRSAWPVVEGGRLSARQCTLPRGDSWRR